MDRERKLLGWAGAAARGALAGMAGALAMRAASELEEHFLLPPGRRAPLPSRRLAGAVVDRRAARIGAAAGMDLAQGALWGALHGVGRHALGLPTVLHGLLLGAAAYAATAGPGGVLARAGVLPSPLLQPLDEALVPVGAYSAFGLATAAAYRALEPA